MPDLPDGVVLVLHDDGRVDVAGNVDDARLAAYLLDVAALIESGAYRDTCPDCASGTPHEHNDSDPAPE